MGYPFGPWFAPPWSRDDFVSHLCSLPGQSHRHRKRGRTSCAKPVSVAVMGCAVNGPGEASDADVGVACGKGCALLFKQGEIIRKIPEDAIVDELLNEISKL